MVNNKIVIDTERDIFMLSRVDPDETKRTDIISDSRCDFDASVILINSMVRHACNLFKKKRAELYNELDSANADIEEIK